MLTEIVRRMEGDEISMEIIDDSVAKIDDGTGSSFRLISAKAEEYPDIDLEEDGQVFEAKCDALTLLVDQSAFAASTKDQRPILTALNLEATGDGQLIATATDSARLARKSIHIDSAVRFRCNVKARILSDIVRLFEGSEYVKVAISASKALFSFDNTVVATRLVAGDYPVTKAIIPTSFNYFLEVNAQELVNAMGRVSILSEKDSAVKLSMREDECEIYAKNERSGSANERIQTFSFNGERLEVSFNPQFVIDAIKALRADDVTLCFQAEMKPFVVKNPRDDSIVELITPMRTY
jgi:DNA polymerase-3 subunit beta